MKNHFSRRRNVFPVAFSVLLVCLSVFAQEPVIKLDVDATDAPRKILHAALQIPARPGKLTLLYPQWIPGEHGPTGPITDLVDLHITAAGKPIAWRRDAVEMCVFHLDVPAGASRVDVTLDFLLQPARGDNGGASSIAATAKLLDLNWNEVLLYPAGYKANSLSYAATLRLPAGWKFGTALPLAGEAEGRVEFAPVSLETLVDSPVIAGAFFRTIPLSPGEGAPHFLHIAADSAEALAIKPEDTRHFARLAAEADALFGARHYREYHFLVTLSDHVAHFGLEHHESSDNRQAEKYLTDDDALKLDASLLPHEMVHSWNGKYRRPVGLATPDFQSPMKGELLWVYEGMTEYLGLVLAARSGLWGSSNWCDYVALQAAILDHTPGRQWRPLSDTAVAAQLLYDARSEGASRRRGVDFYPEGALIWLEADVLIRQQTQGRRSLDDFCRKFCGGKDSSPEVRPYTFDDVVATLNQVAPHDWREFFTTRVYAATPRAPLGGISAAGWRLVYTNVMTDWLKSDEASRKVTDLSFSLGLTIQENGYITDVVPGRPADRAGIGSAMKLLAVNGRRWTPDILRAAVKAATDSAAPIELLVENEDYFKTCKLDYHDGERYPQLERDPAKPDLIAEILKPLTIEPR